MDCVDLGKDFFLIKLVIAQTMIKFFVEDLGSSGSIFFWLNHGNLISKLLKLPSLLLLFGSGFPNSQSSFMTHRSSMKSVQPLGLCLGLICILLLGQEPAMHACVSKSTSPSRWLTWSEWDDLNRKLCMRAFSLCAFAVIESVIDKKAMVSASVHLRRQPWKDLLKDKKWSKMRKLEQTLVSGC